MTNVVYLHGQPAPVAQFLRIGASGHRQLEEFRASGQLPYRRFVIDAGVFKRQEELVSALQHDGCELVLDPNVAELPVPGRYQGMARGAPWAPHEGVLTERHLRTGENEFDVVGKLQDSLSKRALGAFCRQCTTFQRLRTTGFAWIWKHVRDCECSLTTKAARMWP